MLFRSDCVVERVHFQPNEKPDSVGWKAMARTLSDFAAMTGLPQFALVTLVVSADREARWAKEIYRGLHRAADRFAVAIVGGETSRTDGPAMVSVAMTTPLSAARRGRNLPNKWGSTAIRRRQLVRPMSSQSIVRLLVSSMLCRKCWANRRTALLIPLRATS